MDRRNLARGTWVEQSYPWGLYHKAALLCSDGKVRTTKRMSTTADTFFSVPCAVEVCIVGAKYTVAGYMTFGEVDGEQVAEFRQYTYRHNGGLLPPWNEHHCPGTDEMGAELPPEKVTCGICGRSWCERCDPAPSALCHWCHGRGSSPAALAVNQ